MIIIVVGASGLAIALLVLLNIIIGGWSSARLRTPEAAAEALGAGVFGFKAGDDIALDAEGRGALALEAGGARIGLAVVFGDRVTVRALGPGDVRSVSRDGARVTVRLNDYTLPGVTLQLAGGDAAQAWEARLGRLEFGPGAVHGEAGHA